MREHKEILLIEDDKVDAMTVKRALNELNVTNQLHIVEDGEQALAYLNDPHNEFPGLILLDLNMPRMGGREFLQATYSNARLRNIPVVVLTTSDEEQDIIESYKLGVKGYMVKPVDYLQFVEVVKAIKMYWTLSEIPPVGYDDRN